MQVSALRRFCRALELDPETAGTETTPRYHLDARLPLERLQTLEPDHLSALVEAYGDALSLRIEQDGFVAVDIGAIEGTDALVAEEASADRTSVGAAAGETSTEAVERVSPVPGAAAVDVAQELRRLELLDADAPIALSLDIDKARLLERAGAGDARCHTVLYLFEKRACAALDVPLQALDRTLFVDPVTPTLIVALEGDLHYSGQCLTVASLHDVEQLEAVLPTIPPLSPSMQLRIRRHQALAAQHLNWLRFAFERLTPLHLLRREGSAASPELCAILRRHLCHLAILYSASRAVWMDKAFEVDYTNPERTVTLQLIAAPIGAELDAALAELALWPYSGAAGDHLTVLQTVFAAELRVAEPRTDDLGKEALPKDELRKRELGGTYAQLIEQLDHVLDEVRWHYAVFVKDEIDAHFEQVERLKGEVREVARALSEAVDASTRALAEALLAAIGVIVAALLAGLTKGNVGAVVFTVGMRFYAAQVAIQAVVRMGAMLHRHVVREADYRERRETYVTILGRTRVKRLTSSLDRHRVQFWLWYTISLLVYALLAYAAWTLPGQPVRYLGLLGFDSPLAAP
jgi:hypothetical protein